MAVPALSHAGQDRLGQGDQSEEIGLEHGPDLVVFALLNSSEVAITGAIDQHVDSTEGLWLYLLLLSQSEPTEPKSRQF